MPIAIAISAGDTYGRLTIVAEVARGKRGRRFLCKCACGSHKEYSLVDLRTGDTKGCGCVPSNLRHGQARDRNNSKEYRAWRAMKNRCLNPNHCAYRYYGGAGIGIHPEWMADFVAFYNHIGPMPSAGLTVDRIDSTKPYEPGNVRWATRREQVRNRRNNVYVQYEGNRVLARDLALAAGIQPHVVLGRLKRGVLIEDALRRSA